MVGTDLSAEDVAAVPFHYTDHQRDRLGARQPAAGAEYLMVWMGLVGAGVGLCVPVAVAEAVEKHSTK